MSLIEPLGAVQRRMEEMVGVVDLNEIERMDEMVAEEDPNEMEGMDEMEIDYSGPPEVINLNRIRSNLINRLIFCVF